MKEMQNKIADAIVWEMRVYIGVQPQFMKNRFYPKEQ
jgi:hypothetical protein